MESPSGRCPRWSRRRPASSSRTAPGSASRSSPPPCATSSLTPLSEEETARLISSLSDRPVLALEAQQELIARSGGNPLYAEQFVRMRAERRESADLPMPETVQGIIGARLDGLSIEEKLLLQ